MLQFLLVLSLFVGGTFGDTTLNPQDYDFYVQIETKFADDPQIWLFAGCLIRPKTVVTARNSVETKRGAEMWVIAGDYTNPYSQKETIGVTGVIVHPKSEKEKYTYDLALVFLERKPSSRSTISLCPYNDYVVETTATVIGVKLKSGPTVEYKKEYQYLQKVEMEPSDSCQWLWNEKYENDDRFQFCLSGDIPTIGQGYAVAVTESYSAWGTCLLGVHSICKVGYYYSWFTYLPAFRYWIDTFA